MLDSFKETFSPPIKSNYSLHLKKIVIVDHPSYYNFLYKYRLFWYNLFDH